MRQHPACRAMIRRWAARGGLVAQPEDVCHAEGLSKQFGEMESRGSTMIESQVAGRDTPWH